MPFSLFFFSPKIFAFECFKARFLLLTDERKKMQSFENVHYGFDCAKDFPFRTRNSDSNVIIIKKNNMKSNQIDLRIESERECESEYNKKKANRWNNFKTGLIRCVCC